MFVALVDVPAEMLEEALCVNVELVKLGDRIGVFTEVELREVVDGVTVEL